jgi:hypothetical protein
MSEQDYASWVKPVHWGRLAQLPDGRWLTTWQIELEALDATQLQEVAAEAADPEAGFTARLAMQGRTDLVVTIVTRRWGMEVDYYGLTYRLFRLIDARVGRIRLLQGSPREWWSIFRSK